MARKVDNKKNIDPAELIPTAQKYSKEWLKMMVRIWQDKLDELKVWDTGRLHNYLMYHNSSLEGMDVDAVFQFMEYGIYVEAGTGNGYKKDNGGDLKFLDSNYRYEHELGRPRIPKPWFDKSWYISGQVLKEKYAELIGEAFVGAFNVLDKK